MKALLNCTLYYFDPVSDQILINVGYVNLKNGATEWTLVDSSGRIINLGPANFRAAYDKAVLISRDIVGTTVIPMTVGTKTIKVKESPYYFQSNSEKIKSVVKEKQIAMWQKHQGTIQVSLDSQANQL